MYVPGYLGLAAADLAQRAAHKVKFSKPKLHAGAVNRKVKRRSDVKVGIL